MRNELLQILSQIDQSEYARNHYERFIESYNFILPSLKDGMKILDLGSYGHFKKLVKNLHPFVDIEVSAPFDLRYAFPISNNTYDMVCCMEVIEHLKDQDTDDMDKIAEFNQSGIKNLMKECARILKPEGMLFLTTPNINSWMAIHRALNYYSPTFYIPHVKEFSVQEIFELHKEVNLTIRKITTPDNIHGYASVANNPDKCTLIKELADKAGYATINRGDCIFTLATKA